jgi:hypothetical protein
VQQMSAGEFNVLIDALHYQIENQKQLGAPIDYPQKSVKVNVFGHTSC